MNIAIKLAEERRARLAAERLLELKEAEFRQKYCALYNPIDTFIRIYINSHKLALRYAKRE